MSAFAAPLRRRRRRRPGLQVALDAEVAKRKVGRTFLGDLEKSLLGKGKMQAASVKSKAYAFTPGGWVGGWVGRGWAGGWRSEVVHGGLTVMMLYWAMLYGCRGLDSSAVACISRDKAVSLSPPRIPYANWP